MIEILKSLEHLPMETIEVINNIMSLGVWMYLITWILMALAMGLYELVLDIQGRRKLFKFLTDEDIEILTYYLEEDKCCYDIGEIIRNAYRKDIELKRIRKGWWKQLWKKDK